MPTTLTADAAPPKATRPLYLKKVPTPVWERVHVNAIKSGMRLTDYLVAVLSLAEPVPVRPPLTSSPAAPSVISPTASGSD